MGDLGEYGLEFGKPRIVMTKRGEREVCSAIPTEEFWTAYRADKAAVQAKGYSLSKFQDEWQVAMWRETMSREARVAAHEASRAADAAIEIPLPAGCELMPFQRGGVAYALAREGTLFGDEMGLGKTVQAVAFCNAVKARRVLVVAPASLLGNWRLEIQKWQTENLPVHILRPGSMLGVIEAGWVVVNYDIVARYEAQLKAVTWDVVVMDECHYLKSSGAKRTKLLLGGGRGEDKVEAIKATRKLLLTGTPITNRPAEIFNLIHYLDPKRWTSKFTFAKRYCGGDARSNIGTNLDELQSRLRETVMVRRIKSEVLKELPAKRRQLIELEADSDETRALVRREVEAHDRFEAQIADATYAMQTAEASGDDAKYQEAVGRLKSVQGIAFSEMSKLRHEVALAKLPSVIEHLENTDGKVIVFAHHRDVVAGICEALKDHGVVSITGDTPNDQRQPIVERFQRDASVRFFVGNIKAAGVGLTLTASSHVVFGELDWVPANLSQAEDRAHRIGQSESVLVQHIVLDGSLDARMAKTVIAKQAVIDKALDRKVEIGLVEETVGLPEVGEERKAETKPAFIELPPEKVEAVHAALRIVAGYDTDRAQTLNGIGFSKIDTRFGCELAERRSLTPRQAAAAAKMIRKYRRQYPAELYEKIFA